MLSRSPKAAIAFSLRYRTFEAAGNRGIYSAMLGAMSAQLLFRSC